MTNVGNQHFSSLQSRAQNLHANTAQLDKQQKDVVKATEGLKKETEKLRKWADEGQRMVKELGNVQNWAEMLERDFLVLGETIRLANGGGSHSGSGSGSESEWETDSGFEEEDAEKEGHEEEQGKMVDQEPGVREEMRVVDAEGDTEMHGTEDNDKGKGKAVNVERETTNTEHQSEDLGGSSTATGSDPSSSSVHTAASAAS
jgi:hypothetical protein